MLRWTPPVSVDMRLPVLVDAGGRSRSPADGAPSHGAFSCASSGRCAVSMGRWPLVAARSGPLSHESPAVLGTGVAEGAGAVDFRVGGGLRLGTTCVGTHAPEGHGHDPADHDPGLPPLPPPAHGAYVWGCVAHPRRFAPFRGANRNAAPQPRPLAPPPGWGRRGRQPAQAQPGRAGRGDKRLRESPRPSRPRARVGRGPPPPHLAPATQMGLATAEAVVRSGNTLVPYTLTGSSRGVRVGTIAVEGTPVELVAVEERTAALQSVLERWPDLVIIDYTLPSAVNGNGEFYCDMGVRPDHEALPPPPPPPGSASTPGRDLPPRPPRPRRRFRS